MIIINTYHQSSCSSYTQLHHQGYLRFMDLFNPRWHRVPMYKNRWNNRILLLNKITKR